MKKKEFVRPKNTPEGFWLSHQIAQLFAKKIGWQGGFIYTLLACEGGRMSAVELQRTCVDSKLNKRKYHQVIESALELGLLRKVPSSTEEGAFDYWVPEGELLGNLKE